MSDSEDAYKTNEMARKRQKCLDGKEEEIDSTAACSICFENASAANALLSSHQCNTCKKEAWNVCEVCNEALLSRVCPFCKADYAALILVEVPGLHLSNVRHPSTKDIDKKVLMFKIKALESLIPAGNTLLWCPSGSTTTGRAGIGRAIFSLPRTLGMASDPAAKLSAASAADAVDDDSDKVFTISLNMEESALKLTSSHNAGAGTAYDSSTSCFDFVNSTWSTLEAAAEGPAEASATAVATPVESAGGGGAAAAAAAETPGEFPVQVIAAIAPAPVPAPALPDFDLDVDVSNLTASQSAAKILRFAITTPDSRLFLPVPVGTWADMEEAWTAALQ